MEPTRLPDDQVKVKVSTCGICDGIVSVAVSHLMSKVDKNRFAKEAMEYNLSIKEQSLISYREENAMWCSCDMEIRINL